MLEQEVHEVLVDGNGNLIRGQEGGITKVLERLDEMEAKLNTVEAKISKLLAKLPTSKVS